MKKMGKRKKTPFMEWIDGQLDRDPQLRRRVEEALNEMRLEQDLIALREELGMSQKQIAKRMGVSQPAIAKMESGKAKNLRCGASLRHCRTDRPCL